MGSICITPSSSQLRGPGVAFRITVTLLVLLSISTTNEQAATTFCVPVLGLSMQQQPPPTQPKILSVGLGAVDFVATVDHFPEPDEKMRSSSLLVEGGGNAANTACAIAGLFPTSDDGSSSTTASSSNLLTAVGDDPNGNIIIDGLTTRNVNVLAERYPGNSPFSYILANNDPKDGSNTRTCIHQPSSGDMSVGYVLNDDNVNIKDMTAVHFDVRYPTAAVQLAKKCIELNIPYSVDVERPRDGLEEILKGASVVICNSEYCQNVDEKNGEGGTVQCLTRVMKKQAPHAKIAVQTLGSKGSCLVILDEDMKSTVLSLIDANGNGKKDNDDDDDDDTVVLLEDKDLPGLPVVTLSSQDGSLTCSACSGGDVVDSTGAGDAFIGGFLSALWAHHHSASASASASSLNQAEAEAGAERPTATTISSNVYVLGRALRIGSRVAARKLEKPGARSGLPKIDEDSFLQKEFDALLEEPSSASKIKGGSDDSTSGDNVGGFFQKVLSFIK
eukprot:CAMPEP_0113471168 /NCGR_PEP_ID=MMETSP0014_2-20120614/16838_1 /TAXON_ID=2857 /ORGANISM="Nitzschia sp." /LENGTH=502 /DNA_ID=CAMNT_0000363793 /DNA_START=183 /DNA_END=1691 /DNA_ORIENTATION=+ /assembly_acc=CAM_ASM_000159